MEVIERESLETKRWSQNLPSPECPVCIEMNQTSYVKEVNHITTLMAFSLSMDDEGGIHNHDANKLDITYECSKNHKFGLSTGYACDCGWQSNYRKNQHLRNK